LPIDAMTWLALAVVVLSLLLASAQVIARLVAPESVPSGFTTLIVLILFLGGIQLLCFSIIGSYLMHIYDEVKRRPPYVVDYELNAPTSMQKHSLQQRSAERK
jgi:ABC-type branched-subunit amino acid transport system permease subunit